jgi:hypothetical protein
VFGFSESLLLFFLPPSLYPSALVQELQEEDGLGKGGTRWTCGRSRRIPERCKEALWKRPLKAL